MESSEDDAGIPTNASRRTAAREKDSVQVENTDACASVQHESSEFRAARFGDICGMSEDNFDGDSVSSPSTQDVNTSTEAILDMIDEFVEGPGAPRRLPLETVEPINEPPDPGPSSATDYLENNVPSDNLLVSQQEPESKLELCSLPSAVKSNSDGLTQTTTTESVSNVCDPSINNSTISTEDTHNKSMGSDTCKTAETSSASIQPDEVLASTPEVATVREASTSVETIEMVAEVPSSASADNTVSIGEKEAPIGCPSVNLPSSSEIDARDISECNVQERTVKCVTSSELNNDNVTVGSVESTSCDNIVSAPVTRSPLKRRLVRPARPDTTVSSSADSESNITQSPETTTSESIAKDVSSSSDAVTIQREKCDDNSQVNNVCEVSVCRAETSASMPRKIKLIRNKPSTSSSSNIQDRHEQQCQSTSTISESSGTEKITSNILDGCSVNNSINYISTTDCSNDAETSNKECTSNEIDSPREDGLQCALPTPAQTDSLDNVLPLRALEDNSDSKLKMDSEIDSRKVPPIKINLSNSASSKHSHVEDIPTLVKSDTDCVVESLAEPKLVPKLTIKLGSIPAEENQNSVSKLTVIPIKPPVDSEEELTSKDHVPNVTKLNIKPIIKPVVRANDIHRKSSSSDVSESESSENDETSTSDQASASEQGINDVVPKVTIKLGKPGTESEGKFYTEPNTPKSIHKNIENDIYVNEEATVGKQYEKIPKLTIKPVLKSSTPPLSPKLIIKPLKLQESSKQPNIEVCEIPKFKITQSPSSPKENSHVPKITIKTVIKPELENISKSCRKLETNSEVTRLNIKPVPKPTYESTPTECSEDEVPVVSKLHIKTIMKPKDNAVESSLEEVHKVTKVNIKPIKTPELNDLDTKDCIQRNINDEINIPVVTKLNIKPIIKPGDKDSENQSSETSNSSDDNTDQIPVVRKLNIRPVIKPNDDKESLHFKPHSTCEENIPVVTKLNIKPLVKPEEKHDQVPIVTKINIKPIIKPDVSDTIKENEDSEKHPPLVMKINIKTMTESDGTKQQHIEHNNIEEHKHLNNVEDEISITKANKKQTLKSTDKCIPESETMSNTTIETNCQTLSVDNSCNTKDTIDLKSTPNCISELNIVSKQDHYDRSEHTTDNLSGMLTNSILIDPSRKRIVEQQISQQSTSQSCTLLKKLLEDNTSSPMNFSSIEKDVPFISENKKNIVNCSKNVEHVNNLSENMSNPIQKVKMVYSNINPLEHDKNIVKPLEINTISEKLTSSGQDSPRIILKINKTDHGSSSEIITEDVNSEKLQPTSSKDSEVILNHQKETLNSKSKKPTEEVKSPHVIAKRLRSARGAAPEVERSPLPKRNLNKRCLGSVTPVAEQKEADNITLQESKRVKLGKILMNESSSSGLQTANATNVSPPSVLLDKNDPIDPDINLAKKEKVTNSLLNNDNCSKNGSSKLHKILSSLQAKHSVTEASLIANDKPIVLEQELTNTSTASSEVTILNCHEEVQEMLINESSVSRDFSIIADEMAQDPLEVDSSKIHAELSDSSNIPITPTPKKRGRPRKLPASDEMKPVTLPKPALKERPQRSLRLTRERPVFTPKPRGRGRGRGSKRSSDIHVMDTSTSMDPCNKNIDEQVKPEELDPTSSRVKLPRMTEALDKSITPLRRISSMSEESFDTKVSLDNAESDELMKSPDYGKMRSYRGGRGRGKTPIRSPRFRARGRGGGRGAVYMKETLGIYGRVCGPSTTTVAELFEEETCMMDDNATPSKPSHILDEDSQSSVKSSTNDSSKMRKSKFADLFDSNKVWTAADVKEYKWPPPESRDSEYQVMMIQEQVAMFLGVKSFKRRYPELKRRTIVGEERSYVLSMGLVTEALCDLGITAVDASDVLDIMLSDFPHKYEEYRSNQRNRQIAEANNPTEEKFKEIKIETKVEKPEPPKVDPEKLRQEMAAAAIASASEFNSRLNAFRRPACVDLQTLTFHKRRQQITPKEHIVPAVGLYPHALLPAQYQHSYVKYTPEQLRYFPLNTALEAPPPLEPYVESCSDSEPEWGSAVSSTDDSDRDTGTVAKRKKLTKRKRSSHTEVKEEVSEEKVEVCRVCGLREEGNRKVSHDRFLACANCLAKLHPNCLDLGPDTIRKCRDYPWQCPECKTCGTCQKPADDDKMLFCDLCDRGFHIYCVGLNKVPSGRWHCVECAICKSCGAREPGPPNPDCTPEWHYQSKRGPSGHKVYSHSLCSLCASKTKPRRQNDSPKLRLEENTRDANRKAYRIGRYCPLCERSFIGPKGTMQLVICKLCDRQLHQDCVKQTVSNLNVLDYTCNDCRRGGITSRAAAVRLAPRTIATLFMAKRRFNKYAHRQYMQSRMQSKQSEDSESVSEFIPPEEVSNDPLDVSQQDDETANAVKALQMDFD